VKKIFLTGASAGIGRATAEQLCLRGHEVWGTARSLDRLPVHLPNFHPILLDLTSPESIQKACAQVLKEAGRLDVLINNAGFGIFGPLEHLPDEEIRRQMETLYFGPLTLLRTIVPHLRKNGGGTVINVSSLAAEFPIPFLGGYSAGKAALSAATESMCLEMTGGSVTLVDLRPGDIKTKFHETTLRLPHSSDDIYEPALSQVWATIDKNMNEAPGPEIVARKIVSLIETKYIPPVVAVGNFFQAHLAPLLTRIAARSWVQWGQRVFYRINPRKNY
jgi:short-subunit dehydrogenase